MNKGRPSKFDAENYLDAVKKTRSLRDRDISKLLGVDRSRITRFRNDNPNCYVEAEDIIKDFNNVKYYSFTFDVFKNISLVEEWINLMESKKKLANRTKLNRLRRLYNVCQYLEIHPDKLTLDRVSELCIKLRDMKNNAPVGLKYENVIKPLRNWFQLVHGVSAELLNLKGLNTSRTYGYGKYACERITKEQRKAIEDTMWDACREYRKNLENIKYSLEKAYYEMMGLCHFMYYSATRKHGTVYLHFGDKKHVINKGYLELHVIDKGNESWNKLFVNDGYDKIEEYLERNFNVYKIDDILKMDGVIFPLINRREGELENKIMRYAQEKAGCIIIQPNHIWRHTFAQDCLYATNWNYELVASLGGWKTSEALRDCYGDMNNDVKRDGLKEAMGIKVKKEIRYLKW